MWATTLWNEGWPAAQWGAVIAISMTAVVFDLRSRRIPNWLTFSAFPAGLLYAVLAGGWTGLADGLAAGVLIASPFFVLFALAGGGAGDVKLMGAIGAWMGLVNGIVVLAAVALMGIAQACVVVLARRRVRSERAAGPIGRMVGACTVRPKAGTETVIMVPYGVAIFFGVLVSALGVLSWRV